MKINKKDEMKKDINKKNDELYKELLKKDTAKNVIAIRAIDEAFLLLFWKMFINENASSAGTTGIIPEKKPSNILEFLVLE